MAVEFVVVLSLHIKVSVQYNYALMCTAVCIDLASIQGRLKYGLLPIAGVIVRMRFKLPRIWVIVLRT